MKICHMCLSCFYIDGFQYQENVLPRLHKQDGHEVRILASTETYSQSHTLTYVSPGEYLNEDGIPVKRLSYRSLLPGFVAKKLRMHPGVHRELTQFKPDVILFHGLCGWELLTAARYAAAHQETTLFVDSHEATHNSARTFLSKYLLHGLYYRWIVRKALGNIRKVLCISQETTEFVQERYGVPPSLLEDFPLGGLPLSDDEYHERRNRARRNLGADGKVLVVQGGKMGRRKKLIESLRAFSALASTSMELVLIGSIDEEIRGESEALIARSPNVRFLGWKAGSELTDILCAADVYLQPGTQSSLMQDAICARCAIVADDAPSYRSLVTTNGWRIDSVNTLDAILRSIDRDPDQLLDMQRCSAAIADDRLDYRKLAARLYR